jgi:hypothetical protein
VADADNLLDGLVTFEKSIHAADVSFTMGRVWTAGGTPAENDMVLEQALSGVGQRTTATSWDRERAYLIQWPAGQNSIGRPVTLKKWYHTCGPILSSHTVNAGWLQNTVAFTPTERAAIATACNVLFERTPNGHTATLCARSGRDATGPAEAHAYLEHHQLGDQWR